MKLPDGFIVEYEYEYSIFEIEITPHTKELVKCKDCIHFEPIRGRKDGYCNYKRMTTCGELAFNTEPDEYCSFAEKRKEGFEE